MRKYSFFVVLILAASMLGCSRTKNTLTNRKYHAFTAKYNAYFNGYESYKSAVKQYEEGQELNLDTLLPLFVWPTEDDAGQVFQAMDRAIEKSAKVIKRHSMVFRGKQVNPYIPKAYLLIAKSRFYKHERFEALEAAGYIVDHFSQMKEAEEDVFEAKILQAWVHIEMDNLYAAETILDDTYTRELPKKNLFLGQKTYALLYLKQNKLDQAIEWLAQAAESAPNKEEKIKLTFLRAQLNDRLENFDASEEAYAEVVKMHPANYDMAFAAIMGRIINFNVFLNDIEEVEKDLKKLLKDDKNRDYNDQIYYVWALKKLDLEYYEEAEQLLQQSIATSTTNTKQKGKSHILLANLHYKFKIYVPAQQNYDSALAVLPTVFPGKDTISQRAEVLTELVKHLDVIALEDSLQYLASLTKAAQITLFEQHIENLKRLEAEAAERAELEALNAELQAQNQLLEDAGPKAGGGTGKWYFYNPSVRAKGVTAFKKIWGDRKLEDHWRTAQKPMDGLADFDNPDHGQKTTDSALVKRTTDKHSVDYYLERVPSHPDSLKASLEREAIARAEAGFVYANGLGNNTEAMLAWDKYTEEFEGYALSAKVHYGKYLAHREEANLEGQRTEKAILIDRYSTSAYAQQLMGEAIESGIPEEEQAAFDAVWEAYTSRNQRKAQKALEAYLATYPNGGLKAKAALLGAYITGLGGDEDKVATALREVAANHKGTPEATRALQLLMLFDPAEAASTNVNPGKPGAEDGIKWNPSTEGGYKFVVAVPTENVDINKLRNAFADFNKEYFKFDNLKIQNIFYDQNTQLIIISGLRSYEKAQVYFKTFNEEGLKVKQYIPEETSSVFTINNANFGILYRDKALNEYVIYFKKL